MARSYQNHNPRVSTGYRHDRYKFPSSQVWDLCITDNLKRKESTALKPSSGKFDQEVHLSQAGKGRLTWWINNIQSASNDVSCSDPDVVISSAASIEGWGCECQGVSSGGLWLPVEAAFFALKAFRAVLHNKHVRFMLDNTTAMSCINHRVTSHSDSCNDLNFSLYQDLTMW